jgi:hypothetical protein
MDESMPPQSNIDRGRILGQIVVVLVVIVLLVNVPISYRGTGLVHSVPEATAVVIYDGMALKGSGQDIYILENHKLRRFSSPDTFNYFQRRYYLEVNVVDDDLLTQFAKGRPIRHLVKCDSLSHVYALENRQKRLVNDLFYFDSSSRWDKVGPVVCKFLQALPDGPPILAETTQY